jgi:hypothetical protein
MVSHEEIRKLAIAWAIFATSAWGDPALFERIHKRNVVEIVIPGGECEGKVVKRALGEITVKLKRTTAACGQANTLVRLSSSNLRDVVDNRRSVGSSARGPRGGKCEAIALPLIVPATVAVAILTRNAWAGLAISAGGGVAAGILCNKNTRYTLFLNQIDPAQQ